MQQVRKVGFEEFSNIYQLYLVEDFPEAEVKPLEVIKDAFSGDKYTAYVLEDDRKVNAYASFIRSNNDVVLLDYFAVTQGAGRGGGLGSYFIRELVREVETGGFILECEVPEKADNENEKMIRQKRIAFYERNGALVTDTRVQVFGVDFQLLYMPVTKGLEQIDIAKEFLELYRDILPEELYKTSIIIN